MLESFSHQKNSEHFIFLGGTVMENILNHYENKLFNQYGQKGYRKGSFKTSITQQEKKVLEDLYFFNDKKCIVDPLSLIKIGNEEREKYSAARLKYNTLTRRLEKELSIHPQGKFFDFKIALKRKMIQDQFRPYLKNVVQEANDHRENIEMINVSIDIFIRVDKTIKDRPIQKYPSTNIPLNNGELERICKKEGTKEFSKSFYSLK
jgi:hypothetical protein